MIIVSLGYLKMLHESPFTTPFKISCVGRFEILQLVGNTMRVLHVFLEITYSPL